VTSAAVRDGVGGQLRAEYMVALWLLVCVAIAIDRRTIRYGRIGLVRDNGIALAEEHLKTLGFRRGPKRDGYAGDYFVCDD
jgi:hypothetical protein